MAVTKGPQPGAATPLKISQEGAKRFFAGLSWDPPGNVGENIKLADGPDNNMISKIAHALYAPFEFLRVGAKATANLAVTAAAESQRSKQSDGKGRDTKSKAYDLDLDCYIFDAHGQFLRIVGTEDAAYVDPSKKVYHTGDDQQGGGGPDDEQVFVETRDLPAEYAHFFFVVKCDSKFDFSEYSNPTARLVDSKSGESQLEVSMSGMDGKGKFNYIFCRVSRTGDGGWQFVSIDKYVEENFAWETTLPGMAA